MWSPSSSYRSITLQFLLYLMLVCIAETREHVERNGPNISAIFVFGDSTVDSGNNNYIKTISMCNFPPYGRDFPNHIPTGRFTNGRLVTDFIASYLGVKDYVPPYLDPTLSLEDMKTGVCFASAGSGFDPFTPQLTNAISIQNQLKYFKEYMTRMEVYIGKERTKSLINKAVFIISAGTNDFSVTFYGAPFRPQIYNISTYKEFILQQGQQFLQGIIELGGQKIGFVGVPPIGCVPAIITLHAKNALTYRGCVEFLSSIARDYNRMLQIELTNTKIHDVKIVYLDIYKPIDDMIKTPQQFGFDKVNVGCCGSGLIEIAILCNPSSFICSDPSKYIFWDSVHPTESAYYNIFQALRPMFDVLSKN
ncbi:hypothetical protein ACJIZ3_006301 [Penstemon smallii]|uniref:GDSL esterase/lipase At5g45960-like n=1 Tax=Penstemon smallii TaxID=265156 RepID=A0ABD3S7H3_9LAMI